MTWLALIGMGVLLPGLILYLRLPVRMAVLAFTAALLGVGWFCGPMRWLAWGLAGLVLVLVVAFSWPALRRVGLSGPVFALYRRLVPKMSSTEAEALAAGTVWWDGELFRGLPDWQKLYQYAPTRLTAEEQAFLDGPVEQLCALIDDWQITHELKDLPAEVWAFIKEKRFFGMIIPKQYGGLGFSNYAHSQVVMKLASRSGSAAVTVMVPNSLGPAELLLHYGTPEQQQHYLPRLARGEDVPCFALTSPEAGSDAGAIPDFGVVCHGLYQGEQVLGVRLNWEKRYITLGPVATVLGLAFRLYDPDQLLSSETDRGVTLALIPTQHPGVCIGRRHFPLNAAFMNGPNWGRDVFIPMSFLIGGEPLIGHGWRMLMECLAVGRSISLPSMAVASGKVAAWATGAYARVRMQFNVPVGQFEGIEEALARIGGYAYQMDAARELTLAGLDAGEKPAVLSGIVKYHLTERMRLCLNDAMDVHGGKGICMGPNNYLGRAYQQIPIAITVEGANILTRSMIIFGQGAIRCHPYVLSAMKAAQQTDAAAGLRSFDGVFWKHMAFVLHNHVRAWVLGVSGGLLQSSVAQHALVARYEKQLNRRAAQFAMACDLAMFALGGKLKFREKTSGRLADMLSQMYLACACMKRFLDQDTPVEDEPLFRWAMDQCLHDFDQAFDGLSRNFPKAGVGLWMRWVGWAGWNMQPRPTDATGHAISQLLMHPTQSRTRLTAGMFVPNDPGVGLGALAAAWRLTQETEAIELALKHSLRQAGVRRPGIAGQLEEAHRLKLVSEKDYLKLHEARSMRRRVVMVDEFDARLNKHFEDPMHRQPV